MAVKKADAVTSSAYNYDNTAKQVYPQVKETYWERIKREQREAKLAKLQQKAKRKEIAAFATAIISCVLVVIAGGWFAVSVQSEHQQLSSQLEEIKSEYDTLQRQNDSKEYDINSSIDYSEIVRYATEELGMVRASSNQVYTYSDDNNSEYIEKFSNLPN